MGDVLFLAHRVPYPPDRGDKIRSFHLLKHIAAHRRVHLIAFADDARDESHHEALSPYASSQTIVRRSKGRAHAAIKALMSGKPVSLTAFDDARIHEAVRDAIAHHDIETIFVFSGQMAQYVPATKTRLVMDFVDMDSAKFSGYADDARGPLRWMMRREARLLGAVERDVAARADASLFVTHAEAALFGNDDGAGRIGVIENGIDAEFFDPEAAFDRRTVDTPTIVFTGQMDYRPNADAVIWFAKSVMPLVRRDIPNASVAIVGRNPDARVRALGDVPGVSVTGEVADVRGWLAAASVVVAPLMLARGVQNKVLEAMAMARPVVASAAAAEGIDHDGAIRVADGAEQFAHEVVSLLTDRPGAQTLGSSARRRVIARYGWAARLTPLDPIMGFDQADISRRSAA